MDNNLNIDIATYQKAAEQELETLRKENFSLKIIIAQLHANMENAQEDAKKSSGIKETI